MENTSQNNEDWEKHPGGQKRKTCFTPTLCFLNKFLPAYTLGDRIF